MLARVPLANKALRGLSLLDRTLVVVGGALAFHSPRDPFADSAWGVWRAGGVYETHSSIELLSWFPFVFPFGVP